MFGLERDMDNDMIRACHMIQELGEQLTYNQKIVTSLKAHISTLKNEVAHNNAGYALRRFNVDLSQEAFESELERMNAQIIIENQTLLQENRQLSTLLKEHEQTMDTVMAKFRNHALAAQQHELTLARHYEALLLSRETLSMNSDLSTSTHVSTSLQRLSYFLRLLLRSLNGEEIDPGDYGNDKDLDLDALLNAEGPEDWALERECEIERLEQENAHLRKLLGIDAETSRAHGVRDEDLVDLKPSLAIVRRSASPGDVWGSRSPSQQTLALAAHQQSMGVGTQAETGMAGNSQSQADQSQNAAMQRAGDFQPGMRAAAGSNRRPSMFGQRGRGYGPVWTPPPERPWLLQAGGNSALDLVG